MVDSKFLFFEIYYFDYLRNNNINNHYLKKDNMKTQIILNLTDNNGSPILFDVHKSKKTKKQLIIWGKQSRKRSPLDENPLSPLEEEEKKVITKYLLKNNFNKNRTRKDLRITVNTLNAKIDKYGIKEFK